MPDPYPAQNRIIRLPEVQALTGQSRSSVYRRAADGTFPAPIKLGERSIVIRPQRMDRLRRRPAHSLRKCYRLRAFKRVSSIRVRIAQGSWAWTKRCA